MPRQPAFPGLRHAMKKKQTRREKFLAEMEDVVPWTRLLTCQQRRQIRPRGGVKTCHRGGATVGQLGVRALERAALM